MSMRYRDRFFTKLLIKTYIVLYMGMTSRAAAINFHFIYLPLLGLEAEVFQLEAAFLKASLWSIEGLAFLTLAISVYKRVRESERERVLE